MTEKYFAWLRYYSQRNNAMLGIAAVAVMMVLAWEMIRFFPLPAAWLGRVRQAYLIAGLLVFLLTIVLSYFGLEGKLP
jgi:mannitol-specific phosphotransferase system IIBC component